MTLKKQSAFVFGILCLAAVAFQNCGKGRLAGDVVDLASISPDQVSDFSFWSNSPSQGRQSLFGESWTVMIVLPRPTAPGTLLRVSNGRFMSEGVEVSLLPENRLQVAVALSSTQAATQSFTVSWLDFNILTITMPKEMKDAGIILNGQLLSSSNEAKYRGSFIERFVEGNVTRNSWVEAVGYNRLLSLAELQGVHRYFEGKYGLYLDLLGWEFLFLGSQDHGDILSFQRDIRPIFDANHCYECHGSSQPAISTYSPIQIENSILRSVGAMPQGYPALSDSEKLKVQTWVDQGAQP